MFNDCIKGIGSLVIESKMRPAKNKILKVIWKFTSRIINCNPKALSLVRVFKIIYYLFISICGSRDFYMPGRINNPSLDINGEKGLDFIHSVMMSPA